MKAEDNKTSNQILLQLLKEKQYTWPLKETFDGQKVIVMTTTLYLDGDLRCVVGENYISAFEEEKTTENRTQYFSEIEKIVKSIYFTPIKLLIALLTFVQAIWFGIHKFLVNEKYFIHSLIVNLLITASLFLFKKYILPFIFKLLLKRIQKDI